MRSSRAARLYSCGAQEAALPLPQPGVRVEYRLGFLASFMDPGLKTRMLASLQMPYLSLSLGSVSDRVESSRVNCPR